jgi:hypothetical protein
VSSERSEAVMRRSDERQRGAALARGERRLRTRRGEASLRVRAFSDARGRRVRLRRAWRACRLSSIWANSQSRRG